MRTKACVITVVLLCVLFVNSGCPLRRPSPRLVFNQGTNGSASEGNTFCVIRDTWGEEWHDEASDMAFQLWSTE